MIRLAVVQAGRRAVAAADVSKKRSTIQIEAWDGVGGCDPAVTPALELVSFEFREPANGQRSSTAVVTCKLLWDREIAR